MFLMKRVSFSEQETKQEGDDITLILFLSKKPPFCSGHKEMYVVGDVDLKLWFC